MTLFLSGFLQVFFVAINTYFLSKQFYSGAFIAAFIISIIWSFNVKKVAFGKNIDRFLYAIGAAFGCVVGLFVSQFFI